MIDRLIQLVAHSNWIIAVTYCGESQYSCWVLTPEHVALSDGERYCSAADAMASGRIFVNLSVE